MTLIAALRCEFGAVICADTQETIGNAYRVSVDKIAPRAVGQYELVIGGAGNVGGLIDDFTENYSREVGSWPAGLSEQDIRNKTRKMLLQYHREEVEHFPAAHDDKRLAFIICIKEKGSSAVYLWQTDGTALVTVKDHALLGIDDAMYRHEIKRYYYPQLSMAHAVMLCINLFATAKATSNYIGGDTQLITVRMGGMQLAESSHVRDLEQRTAAFNQALAELVLACPDLSIRNDEFRGLLTNFENRVMKLREDYFLVAATDVINRDSSDPRKCDPYPVVPGGMYLRGDDGKPVYVPHGQIEDFLAKANRSAPATIASAWTGMPEEAQPKKRGRQSKPRKSKGRQ